jgi:DNA replication protein DnaC
VAACAVAARRAAHRARQRRAQAPTARAREDLLELIDDRADRRATVITAQLPVEHWHGWIGEATIAAAILDRLLHQAHWLMLKGESLRRTAARSTTSSERS